MTEATGAAPSSRAALPRVSVVIPNERLFFGVLGFVGLLILWQAASNLGIVKKILLSSPVAIVQAGIADFGNGTLMPHIGISLTEWTLGFVAAILIGVPLGIAIGWFRRLGYLSSVWLAAVYATPLVALYPLVVLVAGIGLLSKVVIIFLIAIFAVVLNTMGGVRAVDRRHMEIARSFGASQWLAMRSVVLPTTIPFILTGIRIAAARALVGVVIAEFLTANEGLGYYVALNGQTLNTARVFVGLLLIGGWGVLTGEIIRLIEHRFDVWRPALR